MSVLEGIQWPSSGLSVFCQLSKGATRDLDTPEVLSCQV